MTTSRLSGTRRFRLVGQKPTSPDHLVVYIRGSGGDDGREYVGPTTICGRDLVGALCLVSAGPACPACLDGADQAFLEARRDLADGGIRLE